MLGFRQDFWIFDSLVKSGKRRRCGREDLAAGCDTRVAQSFFKMAVSGLFWCGKLCSCNNLRVPGTVGTGPGQGWDSLGHDGCEMLLTFVFARI